LNYKNVYLAGKIEGLSWDEASEWRNRAAMRLDEECISCYNPCIHVPLELRSGVITAKRVKEAGGLVGNEIFAQDIFHLNECNIFLVDLDNPGTGTLVELGMAYTLGLSIIGFGASDELGKHPFVYKVCHCIFDDLNDALDFLINM